MSEGVRLEARGVNPSVSSGHTSGFFSLPRAGRYVRVSAL